MKYCLSVRQPVNILAKADEIKANIKDWGKLTEYMEKWPDKTYIVEIPKEYNIIDNDQFLISYNKTNNIIFCIEDLSIVPDCAMYGFKYYWKYPITSWYELDGILNLLTQPVYLYLGAPLYFSLQDVRKRTKLPIRLCPNLCYDSYIPHSNGIFGTWIRPEDIEVYEPYVDTFEFITETITEESGYFHIYHDTGEWNGNLNLLFKNFNVNVDNRAIPEEIGTFRLNCGQRCMVPGHSCQFCKTAIDFSNAVRTKHFEDARKNSI